MRLQYLYCTVFVSIWRKRLKINVCGVCVSEVCETLIKKLFIFSCLFYKCIPGLFCSPEALRLNYKLQQVHLHTQTAVSNYPLLVSRCMSLRTIVLYMYIWYVVFLLFVCFYCLDSVLVTHTHTYHIPHSTHTHTAHRNHFVQQCTTWQLRHGHGDSQSIFCGD